MRDGFVEKSKAQRELEFAQILKHGNRQVAFRWIREETLRVAEETVKEDIPRLAALYPAAAEDFADLGRFISELARQLKNVPYPDSQVPRVPFPFVCN